jgi:hypothetical protein
MKTATRPDDLIVLGYLLQEGLQSKLSQTVPVQVRCLFKEETLVILAQHRADVELEPEQTFGILKEIILADHRSVSRKVQMYLRVAAQKQPYASYSFTVEPTGESMATATPFEEKLNAPDFPSAEAIDSNSVETESTHSSDAPSSSEASPHPWDQPIQERDFVSDALPPETPAPVKAKSKPSVLPLVVAGLGLSLVVFSTSLYFLSRPCVIGRCTAILEAQKLSEESAETLHNPQSGKEVLEAQQQLTDAIRILESIPVWSSYHTKAQTLLQAYQSQAERVEDMVTALKTGARAGYKSENPPHPPSRWIEVQSLWREAIAQLEELPTDSNLQPLAKQKIKEYKANLAQTNQRLVKERQAQERIRVAEEAALIAQARQGVAQALPHWRLVYATWQTSMNRLKQIPQGTTAYKEAQQLSALYLPKMASARDRKNQEQFATNAYNQGLRLAQLAKTSQANNQWSAAVTHWRNAINYLNQIPRDTFYYGKAQLIGRNYTRNLKQAQVQLQYQVKLQQARSDLNQTCYGKTKVCIYSINNNVIKVRLTPTYLQMVRQTAIAAQTRGDSNAQAGIVNHIMTLGEALEAISDNARLPVEVYNPDGSLVETHSPGT